MMSLNLNDKQQKLLQKPNLVALPGCGLGSGLCIAIFFGIRLLRFKKKKKKKTKPAYRNQANLQKIFSLVGVRLR
jgi:hypothetical protein